ncbi:MAG: histidine kinase [Beijerinckiaceae bacterium]
MTFAFKMFLRLAVVAVVCLALGVLWITHDAGRALRDDVAATMERVAWIIQDRTRLNGGDAFETDALLLSAVKVMSPGICMDFSGPLYDGKRICSGWGDIGPAAPGWFDVLFNRFYYAMPAGSRAIVLNGRQAGLMVASPDPGAITRRAWARVRLAAFVALVMTVATALLALLAVGQALLPARTLIQGMRRLEDADYEARLPRFDQPEFRRVSEAFNDLAGRLENASIERRALTRRLFQVQEEERRTLARELHDEFGQCLTSIGALAASIDVGAPAERPDLRFEARAVSDIVMRMTATLRGALERLRPPELDSLGLDGSLRHLIGVWNRRFGPRIRFRFESDGDIPLLPEQAAVAIYRISQECVTNAVRHGRPSEVTVSLGFGHGETGHVLLIVEDDGGRDGRPRTEVKEGQGILGMHERAAALGGRLDLSRGAKGFKVSAVIPI